MSEETVDRIVDFCERLGDRIRPRTMVGLRFYLWQLVSVVRIFFDYWQKCYGCGVFKDCKCTDDQMAHSNMDARTAWSVAWVIERPAWDARPQLWKRGRPRMKPANAFAELAERLADLDDAAETRPWKVYTGKEFDGQDWLLASFGTDTGTDEKVFLTTDSVHASECNGEGALSDAKFCAEVRNLMPQIIAALKCRAAYEEALSPRNEIPHSELTPESR